MCLSVVGCFLVGFLGGGFLDIVRKYSLSEQMCSWMFLYRRSEDEVDMDKVTAAMVLTSLSTSPLVRSPPVKVTGECRNCSNADFSVRVLG